jgi:hypothetical protein
MHPFSNDAQQWEREVGALKGQLATERRLRQQAEAIVADQDLHVAACTNELRIVHNAVSALQLEKTVMSRRLAERRAVVEMSFTARLGAASDRKSTPKDAYAALHEEASQKLGVLAEAVADGRTELLEARKELLHTQLLLLQTHAAIGTQLDHAPRLQAIKQQAGAAAAPRMTSA